MRWLSSCTGRMAWPERGVYFFFESGEERSDSGTGLRVVRVGTHALTSGSSTTLWNRLSQHRGSGRSGGGNHRGSIFRLIVGAALMKPEPGDAAASWGRGSSADSDTRARCPRANLRRAESTLNIPIHLIDAGPHAWTLRHVHSQHKIEQLAQTIQGAGGITVTILVRRRAVRFELIHGSMRLHAARLLGYTSAQLESTRKLGTEAWPELLSSAARARERARG